MKDLLHQGAQLRDAPTIIEHSPVGASQSNGFIERGVRTAEEFMRLHKLDLEAKIGVQISVKSLIFAWIVENALDCVNKKLIGHDGRTAYNRLKGKPYRAPFLPFGSPVMYRVAGKVRGGRWQRGGDRDYGWGNASTAAKTSSARTTTARWSRPLQCGVFPKSPSRATWSLGLLGRHGTHRVVGMSSGRISAANYLNQVLSQFLPESLYLHNSHAPFVSRRRCATSSGTPTRAPNAVLCVVVMDLKPQPQWATVESAEHELKHV